MTDIPSGLMRHLSNQERETAETQFAVCFSDIFDTLEVTWANVRELESEFRSLFYGHLPDDRSEVEKNYQLWRDHPKARC